MQTTSHGPLKVQLMASSSLGDYTTIAVTNSGNYSGTNTSSFSSVGDVAANQFLSVGTFRAGNSFHLTVENEGIDSCHGTGYNYIGYLLGNA